MEYDNNMINPYSDTNWASVINVPSCSHEHCNTIFQTGANDIITFNNLISGGLKHIAISNYHPSKPTYPLQTYYQVPDDIIGSPNAEFYNADIAHFHFNGLGSFYEEPEPSPNNSWRLKFYNILQNMQFQDAGGITLNHPAWTKWEASGDGRVLTNEDLCEMLDYDDRVLGIEFYNATCETAFEIPLGWDLDTWDYILKTGRRCWGFCVADHDGQSREEGYRWRGRNILLCNEFTEHECLKAYREGRFYGSIYDTDLRFTEISFENGVLNVSASTADYLNIVIDGVYNRINNNSVSYNIPASAVYFRIEAHNNENSIFSNPIILKPRRKGDSTAKKMLIL